MDEEAIAALYGSMPEKQLQDHCERALVQAGWTHYHAFDSRRSDPGFPDIVAVRGRRLIWRELKAMGGRLSTDQKRWKLALETAGQDYGVWRPDQWGRGEILKEIE